MVALVPPSPVGFRQAGGGAGVSSDGELAGEEGSLADRQQILNLGDSLPRVAVLAFVVNAAETDGSRRSAVTQHVSSLVMNSTALIDRCHSSHVMSQVQ